MKMLNKDTRHNLIKIVEVSSETGIPSIAIEISKNLEHIAKDVPIFCIHSLDDHYLLGTDTDGPVEYFGIAHDLGEAVDKLQKKANSYARELVTKESQKTGECIDIVSDNFSTGQYNI
ncbi:MAG: hypothetical protein U9R08_05070 [Nanoarchaeota archaeon]|nr:hypothetical protein [Nanoarchaeota archaeon]